MTGAFGSALALLCTLLATLTFSLLVHASSNGKRYFDVFPFENTRCFLALGGGSRTGGRLPQPQTTSPACVAVYQEYFNEDDGQYWIDIADAIEDAKPLLEMEADYSKMVVFDIDETVLSNIPLYLSTDFTPTLEERMEWYYLGEDPALPASLEFYKAVREKGFSVIFITGRPENARNVAIANLQEEGFGTKCTERPAPEGAICYFDLIMKPDGDPRSATVYKSEARGDVEALGFEIVAAIGDQWSDLLGSSSPPFLIKMPNPLFYTP